MALSYKFVLPPTGQADNAIVREMFDDVKAFTDTLPSGGGGAPLTATFVTLTSNATLTNERVLTGTANQVIITDNGANSTVVLSLPQSIATSSTPTFAGATLNGQVNVTNGSGGNGFTVTDSSTSSTSFFNSTGGRGSGLVFKDSGTPRAFVGVSGQWIGDTSQNATLGAYTGSVSLYSNGNVTTPGLVLNTSNNVVVTNSLTLDLLIFNTTGIIAKLSSTPFIQQGSSALFIGKNAGLTVNLAVTNTTAVGTGALQSATINSFSCTAVGTDALAVNTDGFENTAFGFRALKSNVVGVSNVAIGSEAFRDSTADDGVAVGHGAGIENTTGASNTAIGHTAMQANHTGSHITAVGRQSLNNVLAGPNTAIGRDSILYLTTGTNNVAVGYSTGSGATPLTTGSYCTILGDSAGVSSTSRNYAIAIGYNAQALANNVCQIGGVHGAADAVSLKVDGGVFTNPVSISGAAGNALYVTDSTTSATVTIDSTGNRGSGIVFTTSATPEVFVGTTGQWLGSTAQNTALASYTGTVNFFTNGSSTVGMSLSTSNNLSVTGTTSTTAVTVTNTTNQLVLGTTRTVTITAPTPATSSRTVTIPDLSGDYSLIGTIGAQTITGAKTFADQTLLLQETSGTDVVTINVAALGASRAYTVPDAGGSAEFVMTVGSQTITGVKTVQSSSLKLQEASGTDVVTVAVASLGADRTYTVPDAGGAASFVMTAGTQTISGTKTFDGQLIGKGTATNDSPSAGYIGEVFSSEITSFTSFPTSTQWGDLTSFTLTAGDWLIWMTIEAETLGGTITSLAGGISTTSGNSSSGLNFGVSAGYIPIPTANIDGDLAIGPLHAQLSGSTTYYLKFNSTYSSTAPKATGNLKALRIR